jgi:DMSO/TMAO reductase YedYZ molybdopterin-dependent catalytic subunit
MTTSAAVDIEPAHAPAPDPSTMWWARLAGVVAGLVGLAVADLIAWVIAPTSSVVPAVGELIIRLLPASLVNWGKDVLGTADKPILLIVIFAGVLVVCGLAGQLERSRRYAGAIVFAALAGIAILALKAAPDVPVRGYVSVLLGLTIGYLVLSAMINRLRQLRPATSASPSTAAQSADRRRFLGLTVLVGATAAAAAVTARVLLNAAGAVTSARARFRPPLPLKKAPPVPAGADLRVPGLTPYVTPNDDFYRIDTALQIPIIDPETWTLRVTGMVENEITINYAELAAKPLVEHYTTLTCVSNQVGGDLASNALWLGYPIRELLAQAKPRPDADMVLSTSDDGWTAGTPLAALTDPDREAILAIAMNGEPLPLEHGFPVRMVVPGLYGYVSATKWVTSLKVTRFDQDEAYWTPLGWSALGPIKIASRIDVPRDTVDAGTVIVAGVAWAQHVGIKGVEVSVDGSNWQQAEIAETTGPDTWRQWRFSWAASSGTHELAVRATDAAGNLQTAAEAPPAPNGATGYHKIKVKVR